MSTISPGVRLGPYEIVSRLGAGGMGEVWKARDTRLDRNVAVKVLPPDFASDAAMKIRFEREAKAISQLSHPHICSIYDVGDGYLAMELLEGDTLRARLQEGRLPPRKATEYAIQIANALAAAHAKGITHRDLKPENVFITPTGGVKLLDFGLARMDSPGDTDSTQARVTNPGTVMGTVGYMSPEQVRAEAVDHRTDVFALGAILYEMLSGRRAFEGGSSADVSSAVLREDPPELGGTGTGISVALDRIVRRCLEKSRDQRFQSAHDVAFALEAVSGSSGTIESRPPGRGRTRAFAWIAAAAVALAIVAAAALAWRTRIRGSATTFIPVTFRNGRVTRAAFTPDGQTVVYSATWSGAPLELFTTRVGDADSRSLGLRNARISAISRSGEMALVLQDEASAFVEVRRGRSMLATMSLSGGAPRPVLEGVTWADWAPDGKTLAAVVDRDGSASVEYPLGHPLASHTRAQEVRVSPDGNRLAVSERSADSNNAGSIVTIDRDGKRRVVSEGWNDIEGMSWRPDGREIWFTAAKSGSARSLWAVDLRGKVRRLLSVPGALTLMDVGKDDRVLAASLRRRSSMYVLLPGANEERDVSWLDFSLLADISEDGRSILFTEGAGGGGETGAVYLWNLANPQPVRIGSGEAITLSPDGRSAMVFDRSQPKQLTILPTGAGLPRQIPVSFTPRWGTFIPGTNDALVSGVEHNLPQRVYRVDLRTGASQALTPPNTWLCAISPSGTEFVTKDGGSGLAYVYPLRGGAPRVIPGIAASTSRDFPLQWSADGTSLFVQATPDTERETVIDLVNVRTGTRRPWKRIVSPDPASFYSYEPDIRITRDGTAYAYSTPRFLSDLYVIDGVR